MKTVLVLLIPLSFLTAQAPEAAPNPYVDREVGRELAKLPFISIFDDISYRVEGYNVILTGAVVRPQLKGDAEKMVRRVEGVNQVINQIEVLPLSPFDESLRHAIYFALVRQPTLQAYFWPNVWSIRIIVKNGDVKLEGAVSNQADADMANLAARSVPGKFSFTSQLAVAGPETTRQ